MIFDIAKNKGKDFFPGQQTDEKVEFYQRRHPMSVISNILITAVMFFLPLMGYLVARIMNGWKPLNIINLPESLQILFVLIGSIYYLALALFALVWWIDYYYDILIVSNSRLVDIEQRGLFNRSVGELYLLRVQDVTGSTRGILQSLFCFCDVIVQSAGAEIEFRIANLRNPYEVAQKIMELHDKVADGGNVAQEIGEGEIEAPTMKIGEILVADGIISKAQLDIALMEQRRVGGRLGSILVRLGYLSEEDLLEALGEQKHCTPFDLSDVEINNEVAHIIPENIARKHHCIAVSKQGKILTVACADPHDEDAISEVGEAIGYKVAPVISPEISIANALDKYYGKADDRLAQPLDETSFPAPAA